MEVSSRGRYDVYQFARVTRFGVFVSFSPGWDSRRFQQPRRGAEHRTGDAGRAFPLKLLQSFLQEREHLVSNRRAARVLQVAGDADLHKLLADAADHMLD